MKKFFDLFPRKISSPSVSAGMLVLDQKQIPYTFRVSRLARQMSLKISPEKGLEVVVPYRHDTARLHHFIREKQSWILRNLDKITQQKKQTFQFVDGAELQILGVRKVMRMRSFTSSTLKKKDYVKEVRPVIFIGDMARTGTEELHIFTHGNLREAKKALEKHLKLVAEKYLCARTHALNAFMGTRYGNITIRGQKTRWGSCSAQNNLNFNWRLIFMPLAVIDYVIFHELTHTVHHNHSQKFYIMLQKFCPEYKKLRKILKESPSII